MLLDLKNDLVFQRLFGKQENKKITEHLLSLILGREVKNIDLDVNKRMLGRRKESKTGRLDVRAKFNDGEDCDIEMQIKKYDYMPERLLDYWSVMYQNKINSGDDYEVLKPSIMILIANYNLKELKGIKEYQTVWNLRERKHPDKIITRDIELHILEIKKIKDEDIKKDELALWLKFIQNPGNKEVQRYMEENRFLKQAKEELAYLSGEPYFMEEVEERARYLREQYSFNAKAKRDGIKIGEVRGQKEKQIEIAKKLLLEKMTIKKISEITDLTEEEIKDIKQKID